MKEKVVLAYSGGLDTTAIIPWLKETYGYEVVCCCINCGQGEELDGLEERAKLSGASKLYIEDLVDDFAENYIVPCVQANATYENKYLLGTSMARPAIAKRLVEIARKEGAVAICHGATGKGNDQIRFELGIKALAPYIKIIAPWRDDKWQMDSREAEIAYCKAHGIDLPFGTDQSYSRDRNLWHISHEGLELENPANEPNYDHLLVLGVSPEKAPDEGEYVTMTFEKGVPKPVNGKEMKVFVHGINEKEFLDYIKDYSIIVTFNGSCFDIPFLERYFETNINCAQIDLRFLLKELGYSGGLKKIEHDVGLSRGDDMEGVNGYTAVLLWNYYKDTKDKTAIDSLIHYNLLDTINLEHLLCLAYNKYADMYKTKTLEYRTLPIIESYKPNKKLIDYLHKNPYKYAPKSES